MNDNKSSPAKKRKANDCLATTDGAHDVNTSSNINDGGFISSWFGYFSGQRDASSGPSRNQNNIPQLDRMEQIMMRVEEKLATVSSLESRCEQLERKCSSLENLLVSTSQSTKEHIDRKLETTSRSAKEHIDSLHLHLDQKCNSLETRLETKVDTVHVKVDRTLKLHEYNEMIVKNQNWVYSAVVHSKDKWMLGGYVEHAAEYLANTAEQLRDMTKQMRRGEFTHEENDEDKGIHFLNMFAAFFHQSTNEELLLHWQEFAAALKQFTPAINLLPDDRESFFTLSNVQLNHDAMLLIKEALIGKPFQRLAFVSNDNGEDVRPGGLCVDAILDVVESNKRLRKLGIGGNRIGRNHIERLCSAVHTHPALVELNLINCFEPGIADEMLTALLTIDGLKLENLAMSLNNITSAVSTLLSEFLATNPRLKELDLESNTLNDSDAALIANALRSNSTLRSLILYGNCLTDVGVESLRLVLCDDSSLNTVADSNHICTLDLLGWNDIDDYNTHEQGQINRGRKIYSILSYRNVTMSNVQHFSDIDMKLLPNVLEAVQTYANVDDSEVKPLSILYEVMRKWGVGNIDTK